VRKQQLFSCAQLTVRWCRREVDDLPTGEDSDSVSPDLASAVRLSRLVYFPPRPMGRRITRDVRRQGGWPIALSLSVLGRRGSDHRTAGLGSGAIGLRLDFVR
jgi:hypothetical protein